MTAEEIAQNGVLVDTEYHEYSSANRRIVSETYELEGETAKRTLGYYEASPEYWLYTGVDDIEKI